MCILCTDCDLMIVMLIVNLCTLYESILFLLRTYLSYLSSASVVTQSRAISISDHPMARRLISTPVQYRVRVCTGVSANRGSVRDFVQVVIVQVCLKSVQVLYQG